MSTAGKVLCILITVPAILWIWLASGVAEMNRNWGQEIVRLDAGIAQAKTDIETTMEEVAKLKSKIDLVQRERDSQLTVMRGQMSQLYEFESMSKETQDRYAQQLASVNSSAEAAERRVQRAVQDLTETKQQLVDSTTELEKVRGENQQDREALAQLRQQFLSLLAENTDLVQKALKAEQAQSRPAGAPTLSR